MATHRTSVFKIGLLTLAAIACGWFLHDMTAVAEPSQKEQNQKAALARAKSEAAEAALDRRLREVLVGRTADYEYVYTWSSRWVEAQLETGGNMAHLQALQTHLGRMKEIGRIAKAKSEAGTLHESDYALCRYYVAEAERQLLRATGK